MKRILTVAAMAIAAAFLPAETANAETIQVGSVTMENPCLIARSLTVLVPRQPDEPPVRRLLFDRLGL